MILIKMKILKLMTKNKKIPLNKLLNKKCKKKIEFQHLINKLNNPINQTKNYLNLKFYQMSSEKNC